MANFTQTAIPVGDTNASMMPAYEQKGIVPSIA